MLVWVMQSCKVLVGERDRVSLAVMSERTGCQGIQLLHCESHVLGPRNLKSGCAHEVWHTLGIVV